MPSTKNVSRFAGIDQAAPKKERTIKLIATEEERKPTSSSLYTDTKSRMTSHCHVLADRVTVEKHVKFFKDVTKGKRVLFVNGGTGIGILPFLCAKHGAESVAVQDTSKIMDCVEEVARDNQEVSTSMTFHHKSVADLITELKGSAAEVPEDRKFDFIFVDWVSGLLTNDGTLIDALVEARDGLLRKSGQVMPDSASLYATGLNDYEFYLSSIDWWSNVYGWKMDAMKEMVKKDPVDGSVPQHTIVTSGVKVAQVNALEVTRENASYECVFSLCGTYQKTTINFLTVYTQMSFGVSGSKGFRLFSNPSDNGGVIQPISFLLPEFVPLKGHEKFHVKLNVQGKSGHKGAKVTISGAYPSGETQQQFEESYRYACYE